MRRTLAALAAAAVLTVPAIGAPTETMAQTGQAGLVNVSVGQNNICALCNTAVAVQAIVQACDLIDVAGAQVLVADALNGTTQTSDCNQTGDNALTVAQAGSQHQGGGRQGRNPH